MRFILLIRSRSVQKPRTPELDAPGNRRIESGGFIAVMGRHPSHNPHDLPVFTSHGFTRRSVLINQRPADEQPPLVSRAWSTGE